MHDDLDDRSTLDETDEPAIAAAPATAATAEPAASPTPAWQPAVVEEVLIEEVSIDGMCGVY